jgi:hypothetical protein
MNETNIIERAFQIAPECGSVDQIRRRLIGEGYRRVQPHLAGKHIRGQLYDRLDPNLRKPHGHQDRRLASASA